MGGNRNTGKPAFVEAWTTLRPAFAAMTLAAALLAAPLPAHAADCKSMPAPSIDWQGCKKDSLVLQESPLDGANLSAAQLSYTDLRGSSLTGANLEKAALVRSSLAGAKAEKANFNKVEAYRTVFTQMAAPGATFVNAELQRADFSEADLTGADFAKAELGRANFKDATITGSKFALANLSRAHFEGSKFEGALDFTGAFLFQTRLEGVDLSQATGLQQPQIDQACGDASTKLPADLKAPADWTCGSE